MAGMLNKYQMVGFQYFQGMPKESHLSSMFLKAPQKASNVMVKLLSRHWAKTLESHLADIPTKEFDSSDDFTWDVQGESRRNIPLIEARDMSGNVVNSGSVGANTEPFYLVFAEDWWGHGEVLWGEKNEVYPLRIKGEVRNEGSNYVYQVELINGSSLGMPYTELTRGKRFSVAYAPIEKELSRKQGTLRFSSHTSMRNEFSRIRLSFKVPGTMMDERLAVGFPVVDNKTGKTTVANTWMTVVEWQFELQWAEYKNNILMYGRSNRNANGEYMNFGDSGNIIRLGDGLRAQQEASNVFYYNTFSLKYLESILMDLSVSKLGFNEREFVIKTGEYGAYQFHKAVDNDVSGWKVDIDASKIGAIQQVSSSFAPNALRANKGQYTEYWAPMGIKVKVEVDPFYDDPVRNKIMHPNGGVAESYRYDIYYMGKLESGDYNIFKCVPKNDPERRGYQWGPFANPFTGSTNNMSASYDEDSAQIHARAALGVCMLDSTRSAALIPAILN